jgi:hypothetical protein
VSIPKELCLKVQVWIKSFPMRKALKSVRMKNIHSYEKSFYFVVRQVLVTWPSVALRDVIARGQRVLGGLWDVDHARNTTWNTKKIGYWDSQYHDFLAVVFDFPSSPDALKFLRIYFRIALVDYALCWVAPCRNSAELWFSQFETASDPWWGASGGIVWWKKWFRKCFSNAFDPGSLGVGKGVKFSI